MPPRQNKSPRPTEVDRFVDHLEHAMPGRKSRGQWRDEVLAANEAARELRRLEAERAPAASTRLGRRSIRVGGEQYGLKLYEGEVLFTDQPETAYDVRVKIGIEGGERPR